VQIYEGTPNEITAVFVFAVGGIVCMWF